MKGSLGLERKLKNHRHERIFRVGKKIDGTIAMKGSLQFMKGIFRVGKKIDGTIAMKGSLGQWEEELAEEQQYEVFTREKFEAFLLTMQESICATAAEADGSGKTFCEDRWQRSDDPSSE
ncbi:hypothetical protein R1sor_015448 [Riccia sorocarpa]|uniref:Uncharacterized protein n=1 Tax=Riccia sorocarpa TaxID=122646 RepID=A0ABD3HG65_9MARC